MRTAKLYPIDGGKRWGAPWYDATGKRRVVTAQTVEEAVAKRAKAMAGFDDTQTLGQYLDWWILVYLPRRVSSSRLEQETVDGYERSVRRHVKPYLGHVKLPDLRRSTVGDWLDELADTGLGARGRQKALAALSVALSVAVQRDLILFNPAHGEEAPRHRSRKVEAWSREEARAFIGAAAQAPRENGDVFLVQLGSGLRPSETLAIHVEDLDLDRAPVRIHHGLAWRKGGRWVIKGKDDVWLILPAFTVEAIRQPASST